jgi:sigma-B regulation protein RsbU (phosphoserine phosphatase)
MAGLPPVHLGANILLAFAAVGVLRGGAQKRWVESADRVRQPQRQFFLDFGLSGLAGVLAAAANVLVHHFPLASTASLVYGVLSYGFFIALDMSLARERRVIRDTLAQTAARPAPRRLYSMTRRFTLMAVATAVLVGIVVVSVLARDMAWLTQVGSDPQAVREAVIAVAYEIIFILAVLLALGVNLIVSYSRNLRLLFQNETGVLEKVSRGDLTRMVPVATRDEFGLIAGHTNSMIEGLRHRSQLLNALKLAEEVQRNLLPSKPPDIPGLDVAGTSLYCYEIGGDYYDYIGLPGGGLGIVVADVSGHGIDAALYMASARAFMISKVPDFRGPAPLLREVNRFLARDSASTGRFMSMFFVVIEPQTKTMRWVRAGHEPAVVFNPLTGSFRELGGEGITLGVMEDADFQEVSQQGWEPGAVLVIGTDGISETRSPANEFFGAARFRDAIRRNAGKPAAEILSAVIAAVNDFRGEAAQEDDVTLVVVKLP